MRRFSLNPPIYWFISLFRTYHTECIIYLFSESILRSAFSLYFRIFIAYIIIVRPVHFIYERARWIGNPIMHPSIMYGMFGPHSQWYKIFWYEYTSIIFWYIKMNFLLELWIVLKQFWSNHIYYGLNIIQVALQATTRKTFILWGSEWALFLFSCQSRRRGKYIIFQRVSLPLSCRNKHLYSFECQAHFISLSLACPNKHLYSF